MQPFAKSLLIVAAVTIGIWILGLMLDYRLALLPSLAISIGLTVLLNLGRVKHALRESR